MSARKRGGFVLQSSVRIGIFATLPVVDRRPLMLANMKVLREVNDFVKDVGVGGGGG